MLKCRYKYTFMHLHVISTLHNMSSEVRRCQGGTVRVLGFWFCPVCLQRHREPRVLFVTFPFMTEIINVICTVLFSPVLQSVCYNLSICCALPCTRPSWRAQWMAVMNCCYAVGCCTHRNPSKTCDCDLKLHLSSTSFVSASAKHAAKHSMLIPFNCRVSYSAGWFISSWCPCRYN